MLEHDTAGDPITGLKWTSKAVRKISRELKAFGIQANKDTVAKIMREIGYPLRANYKKLSKSYKVNSPIRTSAAKSGFDDSNSQINWM